MSRQQRVSLPPTYVSMRPFRISVHLPLVYDDPWLILKGEWRRRPSYLRREEFSELSDASAKINNNDAILIG